LIGLSIRKNKVKGRIFTTTLKWDIPIFFITTDEFGFVLKNETKNPLKIDWDSVSYVDYFGESHKVIHSGIRYIDRNNHQTPTIIPPTSKLTDNIIPIDYIEWELI